MLSQKQDLTKSDESMSSNSFECSDISIKILKNLEALHESREFSDLILIGSDGIPIRTHRIILCASSQYFQETCHNMSNTTKPMQIEVKEFESSTLESVLQFMYTGSVDFCLETVRQVLRAAEQFTMQPLMELCFDFIEQELDGSNCLNTAIFAKEHGYMQLYEESFSFACDRFEEISCGIDFLNLDGKMIDDLLSSNDVVVSSEEKIVQSLLAWLEHDRNREEHWERCLSSVRYQFLTHKFILENTSGLCINLNCHKLIRCWLQWHLLPDKRSEHLREIARPRKSYQTAKFVIVTGYHLSELKVQTYYPEFNTWTYTKIESSWDNLHFISKIVDNDLVIIAGGVKPNGERTNEIKFYNMETEETGLLPSMKFPRAAAKIAILNGYLYVLGGDTVLDNNLRYLLSVERYDFSDQKWEDVASLLEPTTHRSEIAVLNNCLYVVSSKETQCYSTENNHWSRKTPKSEKCEYFGLASSGGYLFTFGGCIGHCQLSDTVERYNPLSDKWDVITRLTSPRKQSSCLSLNNSFLVIGGTYNSKWIDTVEEYNTETNEWKTLDPLLFKELNIHMIF